jgi:hypothetical protein
MSLTYCACINRVPYIEVRAMDDDEARERILRTMRRRNMHGLLNRWKNSGMEIVPKREKETHGS